MITFVDELKNIASGRDFKQKLLCLMAAVVLWAYVGSTRTGEIKLRAPVEMRNLPASLIVENSHDQFVTVRLSGRQEDIKLVNAKNIRAYVDLENAVASDEIRYPVELVKAGIPEGVRVDLSREKMLLSVQRKLMKRVPIVVRTAGDPKEGFILGGSRVLPAYALVSGAESRVREIEALYTKEINVDGQSRDITKEVRLDVENNSDLSVDVQKSTVFIRLLDVRGLLRAEGRARVRNPDERYEYRPAAETVVVYLKPLHDGETTEGLVMDVSVDPGTLAMADFHDAGADPAIERLCPVSVILKNRQDDFRVMHVLPDSITIKIKKKTPGPEPR